MLWYWLLLLLLFCLFVCSIFQVHKPVLHHIIHYCCFGRNRPPPHDRTSVIGVFTFDFFLGIGHGLGIVALILGFEYKCAFLHSIDLELTILIGGGDLHRFPIHLGRDYWFDNILQWGLVNLVRMIVFRNGNEWIC